MQYPTVTPYVLYRDVEAALAWLTEAFGFVERLRVPGEDGAVSHAEMSVGDDGLVMLGSPGADFRGPAALGAVTALVHVMVDDVDAHCERARRAGAAIAREPQDQDYGHRRYDAADPEGHLWSFSQPVRDVAPSEWGAQTR